MADLIFDLDGTLVDSVADITLAANAALQILGLPPVETAAVHPTIGYGMDHSVRTLLPDTVNEADASRAVSRAAQYYEENPVKESRPFPGVNAMLGAVQAQNHRLYVLSNKNQSLVTEVVEHFFSAISWKQVVGIDSKQYKKPHSYYLERFFWEEGSPLNWEEKRQLLQNAHMIGDNNADALLAKNAGISFIGAGWGYYTVDVDNSDFFSFNVARTAQDLLSLVKKQN